MSIQDLLPHNTAWLEIAVQQVCQKIAPIWPLDKSIAVNPWWSMRDEPMPLVAAKLQYLGGIKMLMEKSYYLSLWNTQISAEHLAAAAEALHVQASQEELLAYLNTEDNNPCWLHLGDLLDQQICHVHKMPWRDEIVQQISQFCALYFQYPERMQHSADEKNGFYQMWLEVVRQDKGIEIIMAAPGLHEQFLVLPNRITDLFTLAQQNLGEEVDEIGFTQYCHALLLDINGWASWMAHAAWQAELIHANSNLIQQLLAIRLAWDIVLWRYSNQQSSEKFLLIRHKFIQQLITTPAVQETLLRQQGFGWVWQTALEISFQQPLHVKLVEQAFHNSAITTNPAIEQTTTPELHAIFCIDVRSEPIRRALEAQSSAIKTSGFAGFFGLPIEYALPGSRYVRPQLPGLLKASMTVMQANHVKVENSALIQAVNDKNCINAPPASFGLIEAKGLLKAFHLLKSSLFPPKPVSGIASLITGERWELMLNNQPLDNAELAKLVASILGAMNLTDHFAKRILLVGHASCTTNNPHSSGLDCGACGGQSGEVNVKVLAQILNTSGVRAALHSHNIYIPDETQFVAGLHNTTTDDLIFFDPQHSFKNESWIAWLSAAAETAQKNRAKSVGISEDQDAKKIKIAFEQKANHWAQLRPEWGLANNAAFIIAPRLLTKNIDLQGRVFLHDYVWQNDSDFSTLQLIITAPMVVTNWINLHYYASVTDNKKYGSGNKLLHNVVGGNMGVFEGNGGDLRIGLPFQSVHDGKQWRHQPLRLSVYVAAPQQAILDIVLRHKNIADLIKNHWLYVFQFNDEEKSICQLKGDQWKSV